MRRLFISDLHLQDPQAPAFLRFKECLLAYAAKVDEIYVLGDLVEMWVGDDDTGDTAAALVATLNNAASKCRVFVMHGNRDFLFGSAFAAASGATIINDPHVTDDGILLSHGDALCTDDKAYQQLRQTLRSEPWQAEILAKSLAERQAFGAALREQSRTTNANKPANIMDVNPDAVAQLLATHAPKHFIHGHTHRPGIHQHDGLRRYVLGSWEHCAWLCLQQDEQLALRCISLATRYEI